LIKPSINLLVPNLRKAKVGGESWAWLLLRAFRELGLSSGQKKGLRIKGKLIIYLLIGREIGIIKLTDRKGPFWEGKRVRFINVH
jgi:hypothetical protein